MPEIRKFTLAQEGILALERGDLTFRSQWPCKLFHLAERSTRTLECVECARIRQTQRAAAKEEKRRRTLTKILRSSDTPEDRQRRTANANAARERTRKAREVLDFDRALNPVATWYVPSNLLTKKEEQ